jgi:predicted lipid carrier protein YhbT
VASARQVEAKLRRLIGRLDAADPMVQADLARTLSGPRLIQVDVPDLETTYWTELADGRMGTLRRGEPEDADIRITAESDDLVAMIDGTKPLFSSYLAGHIKVQASLSDLMALRRLM